MLARNNSLVERLLDPEDQVSAMSRPVPAEPLWAVFTPAAIAALQPARGGSTAVNFRLRVLSANGLHPDHTLRAYKAAWEVYLLAAFAAGLFEGEHGADLRARLTGTDNDNFRSALSECMTAWYLTGPLRLRIEPRPKGRGEHCLEFALTLCDGDIKVEVKAPCRPITSEFWWGDDSDLLENALREGNKQFDPDDRNLLVLTSYLRLPIPSSAGRSRGRS